MEETRQKELEESFVGMMEERLKTLGYCTVEEVIELVNSLTKVLFSEFPDAGENGIQLSRHWESNKLFIKSYPEEIFPQAAVKGEAEKLAAKMKDLKCCQTTFKQISNFWENIPYIDVKYSSDQKYQNIFLEIETL